MVSNDGGQSWKKMLEEGMKLYAQYPPPQPVEPNPVLGIPDAFFVPPGDGTDSFNADLYGPVPDQPVFGMSGATFATPNNPPGPAAIGMPFPSIGSPTTLERYNNFPYTAPDRGPYPAASWPRPDTGMYDGVEVGPAIDRGMYPMQWGGHSPAPPPATGGTAKPKPKPKADDRPPPATPQEAAQRSVDDKIDAMKKESVYKPDFLEQLRGRLKAYMDLGPPHSLQPLAASWMNPNAAQMIKGPISTQQYLDNVNTLQDQLRKYQQNKEMLAANKYRDDLQNTLGRDQLKQLTNWQGGQLVNMEQDRAIQKQRADAYDRYIDSVVNKNAKYNPMGGASATGGITKNYKMMQDVIKAAIPEKVDQSLQAQTRFAKGLYYLEKAIKTSPEGPFSKSYSTTQAIWTNVALEFKEAKRLGAVTGPDMGLMLGAIPDNYTGSSKDLGKLLFDFARDRLLGRNTREANLNKIAVARTFSKNEFRTAYDTAFRRADMGGYMPPAVRDVFDGYDTEFRKASKSYIDELLEDRERALKEKAKRDAKKGGSK